MAFLTDKPVLGKISLVRRAKSAVSRISSAKKSNDKHPLFHVAWEEQDLQNLLNLTNNLGDYGHAQPAQEADPNIKDENDEIPTVEEVKRHMEMFHLRKCTPPISQAKTEKYVKSRKSKTARNK